MRFPLFILAAILSGCSTPAVLVVSENTQPISVQSQTNRADNITVVFPAGIYSAAFQTKDGIYYKAPQKVAVRATTVVVPRSGVTSQGTFRAEDGGLFFPNNRSNPPGLWMDSRGSFDAGHRDPVYYTPLALPLQPQPVSVPRSAPGL